MKIDAHQHFWHYDPAAYDWIDESMAPLRRDFLPRQLKAEMDSAGFERSVAVQARQSIDETRWLLKLADTHDWIAGVIGWVDLQSDDVEAQLEEIAPHPKLLGVRHVVQAEPDGFMARPEFRRGVALLDRFGLTYDILIYARQFAAAIDLVRALPDQRFILDHLGKPDVRRGGLESWARDLGTLSALPHVWCKLSGLVTEADWAAWTPGQLRPYFEAAVDAFGPDRLMIGSDWPVCTLAASYGRVMELAEESLAACSAAERARILGGTAQDLWNL